MFTGQHDPFGDGSKHGKKTSELTIGLGESTSSYANHSEVLLVPGFWLIAILTGAYIAGNFREWSMMTTVVIIIPATPSNPSIPYVKRTSKHFVSWNALPWRSRSRYYRLPQLQSVPRGNPTDQPCPLWSHIELEWDFNPVCGQPNPTVIWLIS